MGSFGSTFLELPFLLVHVIWTVVLELILEWINSWSEVFVPEVVMEHQKISTMEKLRKLFKLDKGSLTLDAPIELWCKKRSTKYDGYKCTHYTHASNDPVK